MIDLQTEGPTLLATYLERTLDASEQKSASLHIAQSASMAHVQTRGRGFSGPMACTEALASVIVSRSARSMSNPTDMSGYSSAGLNYRPGRVGWNLNELSVLNSYRRQSGSLNASPVLSSGG